MTKRDQIILHFLPYLHTVVSNFVRINGLKDPDEIYSYARYQLTLIAEHMVSIQEDQRIYYLRVALRRRLKEYNERIKFTDQLADYSYEDKRAEMLVDILDSCNELERKIIISRHEGHTYEDIAKKFGVSLSNIYDMVKDIRKRV